MKIASHSESVSVTLEVRKDLGLFGGPNMWIVSLKGEKLQWVDVSGAEAIVGHSLPRYTSKGVIKKV